MNFGRNVSWEAKGQNTFRLQAAKCIGDGFIS
jgi:hypothetical protein